MMGGDPGDLADEDSNLFFIGSSFESSLTATKSFRGYIYEKKCSNYYMTENEMKSEVTGTCSGSCSVCPISGTCFSS